jgi:purine-binding chemotaxis protein CheW
MSANTSEEVRAVAFKASDAPREVLSLRLGDEEYGIDILRVQEIRSYEQPTRIAGAPPQVLGVTNLRGVIVPIVDLRCSFALPAAYGEGTVTVVIAVAGRTIGAVVDGVSDVVALQPPQIKPGPEFNSAVRSTSITGIATLGEGEGARMLILLDIAQLMAEQHIGIGDEYSLA